MHQPWWATVSFFFCQLGGNMVPYLNPVSLPPHHFLRDFNATFNSIQRRLSIQLKSNYLYNLYIATNHSSSSNTCKLALTITCLCCLIEMHKATSFQHFETIMHQPTPTRAISSLAQAPSGTSFAVNFNSHISSHKKETVAHLFNIKLFLPSIYCFAKVVHAKDFLALFHKMHSLAGSLDQSKGLLDLYIYSSIILVYNNILMSKSHPAHYNTKL